MKDAIQNIISWIGDDPNRPGLLETPERVIKAMGEIFSGYKVDIPSLFKEFPDEVSSFDGLIIEKNIPFFSTCEHHMLPFYGVAHFGYLPNYNILIGASKISRLVDAYARRLQIQERMGQQIVDTFMKYMNPKGCMLVLSARHHCMACRGIKKKEAEFITSHIAGSFEDAALRNEFLSLISLSNK